MLVALLVACGGPPAATDTAPSGDTAPEVDTGDTGDTGSEDTGWAPEACNGVDDDLDGVVDEADAVGCGTLYLDQDGDGVGNGTSACLCAPEGDYTASLSGDCDDADATITEGCTLVVGVPGARLYASDSRIWPTGGRTEQRMAVSDTLAGAGWALVTDDGVYAVPETGDVPREAAQLASFGDELLLVADVDDDDVDDLVAVNGVWVSYDGGVNYSAEQTAHVFLGPLAGAYEEADAAAVVEGPVTEASCCSMAASVPGDVDGDGTRDLVVSGDATVRVPLDGGAPEEILPAGYAHAVGDLDGDGLADLGLVDSGVVRIYRLPLPGLVGLDDADATLTLARPYTVEIIVEPAGDLDHDGLTDLRVDNSSIYVVSRPVTGTIQDLASVRVPDFNRAASLDLDDDGWVDLACGSWEGVALAFTGPLAGTLGYTEARWEADPSLQPAQVGASLTAFSEDAPWALAIAAPRSTLGGAQSGEVDFFVGW
ncbi:MAG: FG-GAP repeat domain-containing protein [Myxococcota bacterium]